MLQKSRGIQILRKRISSYHEIEKYSHRLKKITGTLNVMHGLSPKIVLIKIETTGINDDDTSITIVSYFHYE